MWRFPWEQAPPPPPLAPQTILSIPEMVRFPYMYELRTRVLKALSLNSLGRQMRASSLQPSISRLPSSLCTSHTRAAAPLME